MRGDSKSRNHRTRTAATPTCETRPPVIRPGTRCRSSRRPSSEDSRRNKAVRTQGQARMDISICRDLRAARPRQADPARWQSASFFSRLLKRLTGVADRHQAHVYAALLFQCSLQFAQIAVGTRGEFRHQPIRPGMPFRLPRGPPAGAQLGRSHEATQPAPSTKPTRPTRAAAPKNQRLHPSLREKTPNEDRVKPIGKNSQPLRVSVVMPKQQP